LGQSSVDQYELSSDEEDNLTPDSLVETTPGRCDCAALLLTAARLYLNSHPEAQKNWGQVNPNLHDYHADPMNITSTFWLPDITHWWRQQEETHSKYADLSDVASHIICLIPHGVRVEASFCLGRNIICWRQSKTTGKTLWENDVVRQYARDKNGILPGDCAALDTTETENKLQFKK